MGDNRVISNQFNDEEWGGTDFENLETPTKWRYDETTGKLHMLFKDGKVPKLVCSSAKLGKDRDHYCIATLASSQEVLLWFSNQTEKLNASFKRARARA